MFSISYIVSIAQMDTQSSTVSNYAGGGAVGGSWTDKIMDVKSSAPSQTEDGNGADDDEWVKILTFDIFINLV